MRNGADAGRCIQSVMSHRNGHKTWSSVNRTLHYASNMPLPSILSSQHVGSKQGLLEKYLLTFTKAPSNVNVQRSTAVRHAMRRQNPSHGLL